MAYDFYYPDKRTALGRRIARNYPDPMVRDFYRGRFRAGAPVDEFVALYPPREIVGFDGYQVLLYEPPGSFEGTSVVAKDGRLVYAELWSCSFEYLFFNVLTQTEERIYLKAYERVRNKRLQEKINCRIAVVGAAIEYSDGYVPAFDESGKPDHP